MDPIDQILDVLFDVVPTRDAQARGASGAGDRTAGDGGAPDVVVRDETVELLDDRGAGCLADGLRDRDDLEALTRRDEDGPRETHESGRGRHAVVRPRKAGVREEAVEASGRGGVGGEGRQLRLVARDELPEELVLCLVVELVDAEDAIRDHGGVGKTTGRHHGAGGDGRLRRLASLAFAVEPEVRPDAYRERDERLVARKEPSGRQVRHRDVVTLTGEELRPALKRAEHADVGLAQVASAIDADEGVVDFQFLPAVYAGSRGFPLVSDYIINLS